MVVSVVTSPALCLHPPIFSAMPSTEPPDRSILKERSQLESCISALKRWAIIAKAPELCKGMSNNFNNSKGDNNGDIQKIVSWLKEKSSMDKHADMVRVSNQFLNTTRAKSENYAEVKKLGETVSPTCVSILLFLRQAQSTDTDSQIIMMNVEFNPMADIAKQNCGNYKANMKKFRHNKTVNHQAIGNQQKQSTIFTFISLDNNENLNQEQVKAIKTLWSGISARGGMGGGKRGRVRRGQAGDGLGQNKRFWRCNFCICRIRTGIPNIAKTLQSRVL